MLFKDLRKEIYFRINVFSKNDGLRNPSLDGTTDPLALENESECCNGLQSVRMCFLLLTVHLHVSVSCSAKQSTARLSPARGNRELRIGTEGKIYSKLKSTYE